MRNIFLLIIGLYAVIISYLYFKPVPDTDNINVHEQRIDSLSTLLFLEKFKTDSLQKDIDSLDSKLKNQKGGILVVNNKHEKIRNAVIHLSDDSAILYITKRLSSKSSH